MSQSALGLPETTRKADAAAAVRRPVHLNPGQLAVLMWERPDSPWPRQIKLRRDADRDMQEQPTLANSWERDDRGDFPLAIIEAVDPRSSGIDPLNYLEHGSDRPR